MNSATIEIDGMKQSIIISEKTFSSGSTGYFGVGKLDAGNGKRYQIQVQAVLIGSKPKAP